MGRIEFEIHKQLEDLTQSMEYIRGGRKQTTREVMRGDLKRIWKSYQAAVVKIAESERWRHHNLSAFDFGDK
jgi:hypothetical protein